MKKFWRLRTFPDLDSDAGFLPLAREPGLPVHEQLVRFRRLVSSDIEWASMRRHRFRAMAARVKVASLVLTAASTVVLGINAIPARAAIALPMVALVSVLTGLDAYFNWSPRWTLMEEAQYRLQRLRDNMDFYLVTTPEGGYEKGAHRVLQRAASDLG